MCGIVGYVGPRDTQDVLLDGLRRLEYRGYDSAGIAVICNGDIQVRRKKGKLTELSDLLTSEKLGAHIGIGHTRWATHGPPSDENAHPHQAGGVALVHNGIVENYRSLKEQLLREGREFKSATDTEIIAHLIDRERAKGKKLPEAVRDAIAQVEGTYSLAVIAKDDPTEFVAARCGSPLVIGFGKDEMFVASDIPAILPYTRTVTFLDNGEVVIVRKEGATIQTLDGKTVKRAPTTINWSATQAEKGGYPHFMLKEIFEQPRALADTLSGRVPKSDDAKKHLQERLLDKGAITAEQLKGFKKMVAIACGTSWHAALVGRHAIERITRFPVEVDLASEFRYRDPIVDKDTLAVFVSQSGETADTLAALREAKARGATCLSICNVVDSTIARESDAVLYTHAGPEIGVASTKAFTTQLVAFYLLALWIGEVRGGNAKMLSDLRSDLLKIPHWVEETLKLVAEPAAAVARKHFRRTGFLFLGRGLQHSIALEGALKLKEISYIHAEGYPAGEMKHGPIALIDDGMPIVVLAPQSQTYDKVLSNIEEVRARGGHVIAIASVDDKHVRELAGDILEIPIVPELLAPLVTCIPLQLLAYHVAVLKGTDVDQPRNLAKSVTVE